MANDDSGETVWHQVAGPGEIPDDGVKMTAVAGRLIAITHCQGRYGALDNACPHMGGPLGQGHIEDGRLVCPWHGREYDPSSGACEGYEEAVATYPVEAREDGVYVGIAGG